MRIETITISASSGPSLWTERNVSARDADRRVRADLDDLVAQLE